MSRNVRVTIQPGSIGYTLTSINPDSLDEARVPSFTAADLDQYLNGIGTSGSSAERENPAAAVAKRLGAEISEFLLSGSFGRQFETAREGLGEGETLELVITTSPNDSFLQRIPWEFLYEGAGCGFVSLSDDVSIVRSPLVEHRGDSPRSPKDLRVLFIGASPSDRPIIDIQREIDAIQSALDVDGARATLEKLQPPTLDALRERLKQPDEIDVIHISAHGSVDGPMIDLEDGAQEHSASPTLITSLAPLLGMRDDLSLVVLNVCQGSSESYVPLTSMADELLRQGTHFVVANQFEFPISAGVSFASGFYSGLADGSTLGQSMTKGREALRDSHGEASVATPTLHVHDAGASEHRLRKQRHVKKKSQTWGEWYSELDVRAGIAAVASLIASFIAAATIFALIPGIPESRTPIFLAALAVGVAVSIAVSTVFEPWAPRAMRELEPFVLLGAVLVIAGATLSLLAIDPNTELPWWEEVASNQTVVAVGLLDHSNDDELEQAKRIQSGIVGAVNLLDDRLFAVAIDEILTEGELEGWAEDQPIDIGIAVGGSIEENGSLAGDFLVNLEVLASAATQPGVFPLSVNESFAGEMPFSSRQNTVAIDGRLRAVSEMTLGIVLVAEDELDLAETRFQAAQEAIVESSGEARVGSPLLAAMSGFVEVVRSSQTLDRSRVEGALETLSDFDGADSSELAQSTLWSLEYLFLLPEQTAEVALGPCDPAAPFLPPPGATSVLRGRLEQALSDTSSALLQANARALIFRIELIERVRTAASIEDLDPVKSLVLEQLNALGDQAEPSLRLWEADAKAVLANIVRGTEPLYAIALLQQAQDQSTPFYQQSARATIGHILECNFAIAEPRGILASQPTEGFPLLYELQLSTLRRAAACYYETVNTSQPFFELEPERVELAESCDSRTEAVPLLCVYDEALEWHEDQAQQEPETTDREDNNKPIVEVTISGSEQMFRSALGDPDLQCQPPLDEEQLADE